MTDLTREEQREERAKMQEDVRAAFGMFLSPEGQLVLRHMQIVWFGTRSPGSLLASGVLDQGQTILNVGKQWAYFDVLNWIESSKQVPRERQVSAIRAAPER